MVDIGSGAGLPGIPLAIAAPEVRFVLTEPRAKRAAFLEFAVQQLQIGNVIVHPSRAEDLEPKRFASAVARAFAPFEATWRVARPLLKPNGVLVAFTGSSETPPARLIGASAVEVVRSASHLLGPTTSGSFLATAGSLVIITAT